MSSNKRITEELTKIIGDQKNNTDEEYNKFIDEPGRSFLINVVGIYKRLTKNFNDAQKHIALAKIMASICTTCNNDFKPCFCNSKE
jgi:hypothetical protein